MKKKIISIIAMTIVLSLCACMCFAASIGVSQPETSDGIGEIEDLGNTVFSVIYGIATVCAFVALVILGVQYMIGGAEQKSKVKTALPIVALGAVLIFLSKPLLDFIVNIAGQLF